MTLNAKEADLAYAYAWLAYQEAEKTLMRAEEIILESRGVALPYKGGMKTRYTNARKHMMDIRERVRHPQEEETDENAE